MLTYIIYILVSGWLIALAIQDVRKKEVSNLLTIPPLLTVVLYQCAVSERWTILVLFIIVIFVSEFPHVWPLGVAGMAGIWNWIVMQGLETTAVVWIAATVLWILNAIGGADVKTVMTLSALFPDPRLAWLTLVAWWLLSLALFVARYGRAAPRVLIATLLSLPALLKDNYDNHGHRAPALPAVAGAGLVFMWIY